MKTRHALFNKFIRQQDQVDQYALVKKRAEAGDPVWTDDDVSDCCGAYVHENTDICSDCMEHCSPKEWDE